MNKTLIIITAVSGAVLAYIQLQATTVGKSAKEELKDNVAALIKTGEVSAKESDLVKLQLAISDYIVKHQEPPTSLEQLVPDYFDLVPVNPETKKSFEYKRNGSKYEIVDLASLKTENQNKTTDKVDNNKADNKLALANTEADKIKVEEDFIYDPEGMRDPFKPFEAQPKEIIDETKPPLERYDLSQLKVTAVLADSKAGMAAIVEDATGRGYTVRAGSKIGNKNGSIVSIDEKQISVVEAITDFTGQVKQTVSTLKLVKGDDQAKDKKKRR